MIKRNNQITFWHVTNLSKILKEGLKVSSKEVGEEREIRDGLPKGWATGILYLSTDLMHLVKEPRPGKDALLEITVPKSVYEGWTKIKDPVERFYKTGANYSVGIMKSKYRKHPERFPDFEKEIRTETGIWDGDFWKDVYPKSKMHEGITEGFKEFTFE